MEQDPPEPDSRDEDAARVEEAGMHAGPKPEILPAKMQKRASNGLATAGRTKGGREFSAMKSTGKIDVTQSV